MGHTAVLSGHVGLQVRVLELEKTLEAERMRLGELRKQHYVLAGGVGTLSEEEPSRPSAAPRGGTSRKPPLAQKPSVAARQDQQVLSVGTGAGRGPGGAVPVSAPQSAGLGAEMLLQQHGEDGGGGKAAGGRGEVGGVGAQPCSLSPSTLTPAAGQEGWHLPGSARELLGSRGGQQAGLGLGWPPHLGCGASTGCGPPPHRPDQCPRGPQPSLNPKDQGPVLRLQQALVSAARI